MDEVRWLMAREIPRLRRYALALVNDAAAADDLVQDCLERAVRKSHLWKRQGSVRSWLYRILYHLFLNQAVQRNRNRRHVALEVADRLMVTPANQEQRIACRDIASAMMALPAEQRAAIVLTAVEGLSYDEAASVIGVPVGTVRSRLSRGREHLRSLYAGEAPMPALRRIK